MHIATDTFKRASTKDMFLWNLATDLVINAILKKDNMILPQDCLVPDDNDVYVFEFKDVSKKLTVTKCSTRIADEVYDMISAFADEVKDEYRQGNGDGYRGSFDKHIESNDDSVEEDNAAREKWKKVITEAATKAKMAGKASGWMERYVDGLLNPQLDYRTILHRFITKDLPVDYSMRRPGRRYYTTGVYYPSIIRENLEIVIAIDTSGSISDKEYKTFLSEVVGICTSYEQIKARILWWSTEVTDNVEVTKANAKSLVDYKFGSTGGTEMSCVKDYCDKEKINSRVFIFLTDGCVESNPVLPDGNKIFVLSGNSKRSIVKKYGTVCKLK